MFAMTFSLVALPAANAHTPPYNIPTYAFLSARPDPAGAGQTIYLGMWIDKVPPTADHQYGDRWHNFTITVTKPDGTTQTLGPFTSDDTGGTATTFTPSTNGNYTFVFHFAGQTAANPNPAPFASRGLDFVGDYFEPSTSESLTVPVGESLPVPPQVPLPTQYWTRPITAMNPNWAVLGGNWFGLSPTSFVATGMYNATTGNYNPYTTAPNTAHIMWTKPYSAGGMIGGEYGNNLYTSHFTTNYQYQTKFAPIVMNGILYYNFFPGSVANLVDMVAVDLRTGQTLWTEESESMLRCGQILDFTSPNQYGGTAYLWANPLAPYFGETPKWNNTWEMYDAMTGHYILSIVDAPSSLAYITNSTFSPLTNGTTYQTQADIPRLKLDDGGNLIAYYVKGGNLTMWNSTLCIMTYDIDTGYCTSYWTWDPHQGANIPWNLGIEWSVPLATTATASNGTSVPMSPGLGISQLASDVLLMTSTPISGGYSFNPGTVFEAGYSAVDGHLLWGPLIREETPWCRLSVSTSALNGIYYQFTLETMTADAFSLKTGAHLWGPVSLRDYEPTDTYGYFTQSSVVAYDTLYISDLGGYVYALNATTGAFLWDFFTGNAGLQTPYGEYPFNHLDVAADGKIYLMGGHNYSPPMFLGSDLWCLNATTGALIWKILCFGINNSPTVALSDGYLVEPNAYDGQIYTFGMGPSKTTVTAPSVGVTTDTPVTITGTVTDISAGSQQNAVAMNFPNGLPCVSDESMSDWMQFVYQQQPCPANVTGVPVTISAIDPNGNYVTLGNTISDASGLYSFTVDTSQLGAGPGKYTIIATFAGSNGYWPSSSEAALTLAPAPAATPPPTPQPASLADIYFLPMSIVILIAIIVAAIAIMLMLRKR
jgi:hypothetical protein